MTVAVLGLLLLAAAGVLTAAVVTSNTGAVETDLWNATISNVSLGVVFVAGMLTAVAAVVGIIMMMGGVRRNQRLRQERRVLRRENQRLSQRVEAGVDPDGTTTRYPVTEQVTEERVGPQQRRSLFSPRRSTTDTRVDGGGRQPGTDDRVVASDPHDTPVASTEPVSRSG
jgi:hypothetical protein